MKSHSRSLIFVNNGSVKKHCTESRSKTPSAETDIVKVRAMETTFLDTVIYKGDRFKEQSILDIKTHFKPTETFQYTHFSSCHPPSVKIGFVKGEALRLL